MDRSRLEIDFPQEAPTWLECPVCGEETNSLKEYHVLDTLFFALFYVTWQSIDCVACPDCMRRYLAKRLLINFFSANFSWPVLVLPRYLILFGRSFTLGHSKVIDEEFREGYEKACLRAKWAEEDARNLSDPSSF